MISKFTIGETYDSSSVISASDSSFRTDYIFPRPLGKIKSRYEDQNTNPNIQVTNNINLPYKKRILGLDRNEVLNHARWDNQAQKRNLNFKNNSITDTSNTQHNFNNSNNFNFNIPSIIPSAYNSYYPNVKNYPLNKFGN